MTREETEADTAREKSTPSDRAHSFWSSLSPIELAEAQNVAPVDDLEGIAALWPSDGDPDELLDHVLGETGGSSSSGRKRLGPMSVVLLDTTVVSLLHPKKRRAEILDRYAVHMEKQTLALSFQSVAELWNWAEAREWGDEARNGLDLFIKRFSRHSLRLRARTGVGTRNAVQPEGRSEARYGGLLDCSNGCSSKDPLVDA